MRDLRTKVGSSMIATAAFGMDKRFIISSLWRKVASPGLSTLSTLRTDSSSSVASYGCEFGGCDRANAA